VNGALNRLNLVLAGIANSEFFSVGMKCTVQNSNTESYRIIAGPNAHKAISPTDGCVFHRGHLIGKGESEPGEQVIIGYCIGLPRSQCVCFTFRPANSFVVVVPTSQAPMPKLAAMVSKSVALSFGRAVFPIRFTGLVLTSAATLSRDSTKWAQIEQFETDRCSMEKPRSEKIVRRRMVVRSQHQGRDGISERPIAHSRAGEYNRGDQVLG